MTDQGMAGTPTLPQLTGMSYATPAMIPLLRRSQYLADALEAIGRSTQQGIRTPQALGTNLLADALLQYGRNRNDQAILGQAGQDRNSLADMIMGGHADAPAGAGASAPQAPAAPSAPTPPAGPAPPGASPPQAGQDLSQPPQPQAQPQPQTQPAFSGVPRQVVTPQEWALAQSLLAHPQTFEAGVQMEMSLRQREQAPVPLHPGNTYGADGSVHNLEENYQPLPGATPADNAQINTVTGHTEHQALPGVQGPNGSFLTRGGYQMPPQTAGGQTLPFGAPTSDQLAQFAQGFRSNNTGPVAQYYNARTKAAAALSVPPDRQNAATNLLQIEALQEILNSNPNLAVREGLINNITESPGMIARFMQGAQNALSHGGTGYLEPQMVARIQNVIRIGVQERYHAAQQYVAGVRQQMSPLGYPDSVFPTIDAPDLGQQAQQGQLPRIPPQFARNPMQAHQWALQNGLHPGDPVILPDGQQGRVP